MRIENDEPTLEPKQIMDFFKEFEENRRSVGVKLGDLQTKLVELSVDDGPPPDEIELSQIPSDMLSYYLAFAREGATEENIATRSEIMYQKLLDYWKGIR